MLNKFPSISQFRAVYNFHCDLVKLANRFLKLNKLDKMPNVQLIKCLVAQCEIKRGRFCDGNTSFQIRLSLLPSNSCRNTSEVSFNLSTIKLSLKIASSGVSFKG